MKKFANWDNAIHYTVSDLLKRHARFSLHEITACLQDMVNNKKIEISFLPISDSKERQPVIHTEVKNAFNEMLRNKDINLQIKVNKNGYRIFSKPLESIKKKIREKPISVDEELIARIEKYVNRYYKRCGYSPNIKELQSALRRVGNYSCKYLKDLIENNSKDLNVYQSDQNYISKSIIR